MEHLVKVGTHAKVLEELKVTSKPAKVKGKPGRRKQKVAVEDLDDDGAEADEPVGEEHCALSVVSFSARCPTASERAVMILAHVLPNQKDVRKAVIARLTMSGSDHSQVPCIARDTSPLVTRSMLLTFHDDLWGYD